MTDQTATPAHLKVLDGLRGGMAIWVWLGHCLIVARASLPVLENVTIPVQVFMFLSGFVMSWNHYVDGKPWTGGGSETRAFFIKRFFRLSPLYYLLLVPSILFLQPLREALLETPAAPVSPGLNLAAHLSYLFGLFPAWSSNNLLPDWSLSLEMQFYFAFPLLTLFVKRFGNLALFVCAILAMYLTERVVTFPGNDAHFPLIAYPATTLLTMTLPLFAAGMMAARVVRGGVDSVGIGALVACGVALAFHNNLMLPAVLVLTVAALTHARAAPVRAFAAALSSRLGVLSGDLSYSIYLNHLIVLGTILMLVRHQAWYLRLGHYPQAAFLVVASAPFVILFALFSYRFIERPCIRFGNRLIKAMREKGGTAKKVRA